MEAYASTTTQFQIGNYVSLIKAERTTHSVPDDGINTLQIRQLGGVLDFLDSD